MAGLTIVMTGFLTVVQPNFASTGRQDAYSNCHVKTMLILSALLGTLTFKAQASTANGLKLTASNN